MTPWRIHWCNL